MARFWRDRGAPDRTRSRCRRCDTTDASPVPQFDDFSAKYSPDSEDVLKELTLQVKPGEKVSSASTSRPISRTYGSSHRSALSDHQAAENLRFVSRFLRV